MNTNLLKSSLFIRDIQELNKIVLQKDTIVQGLQDQVVNFLDHDYNVLQVFPVLLISKAAYTLLQGLY